MSTVLRIDPGQDPDGLPSGASGGRRPRHPDRFDPGADSSGAAGGRGGVAAGGGGAGRPAIARGDGAPSSEPSGGGRDAPTELHAAENAAGCRSPRACWWCSTTVGGWLGPSARPSGSRPSSNGAPGTSARTSWPICPSPCSPSGGPSCSGPTGCRRTPRPTRSCSACAKTCGGAMKTQPAVPTGRQAVWVHPGRGGGACGQSRSLDHERPEAPMARDRAAGDRAPAAAAARVSGVATAAQRPQDRCRAGKGGEGSVMIAGGLLPENQLPLGHPQGREGSVQ